MADNQEPCSSAPVQQTAPPEPRRRRPPLNFNNISAIDPQLQQLQDTMAPPKEEVTRGITESYFQYHASNHYQPIITEKVSLARLRVPASRQQD
jgi:hypothetical protein